MVEVLKQPPYSPLAIEKQVVVVFAGAKGFLDDIPVNRVVEFENELYPFIEAKYPKIFEEIRSKKALDKDLEAALAKAIEEYKLSFS